MAKRPDDGVQRSVTQYDLAEHLGIGQKTVSRALAGEARVSPKLRSRIEAAAAELGYRPNTSARSIKTRRFDNAMLLQIVARAHHRLVPGIVDGIADGLAEVGRPLLIERLVLAGFEREPRSPRALREAMVDGLLIHVDAEPPAAVEGLIAASNLPVVWLNRQLAVDVVRPDDYAAAGHMVRRLVAAGHRRIGWYDQQLGFREAALLHYSRQMRVDGYTAAMEAAGLHAGVMTPGYDPGDSGQLPWLASCLRNDRPSAIACYSSYEALAVLHVAGGLGLRIPGDLSLITVHHESLVAGVRIDVAALPTEAIGRAGAAMLVQCLGGRRRIPAVAVPFSLIPGGTVAPPG